MQLNTYMSLHFLILWQNFKLLDTKNHVSKHIIIPQYEEYPIFTLVAELFRYIKGKCNEIVQEL